MYDNNENQNFNNNPYNNLNGNGQQPNASPNMQPQYNNYGPIPNPSQNNGYYNPMIPNQGQGNNFFGGNNQTNGYENQMYNNMDNGQEEPPELTPIKPLSSIKAADVPSMDVLSPMNIMPETLPTPEPSSSVEPAYEQPVANEPNYNVSQDFNMQYTNNFDQQANMQYPNTMNQPNNTQYNNIDPSMNVPYPGNINQSAVNYDPNQINNSMNTMNQNSSSMTLPQTDFGINNLYNSSSELMNNVEPNNMSQGPTMPQPVYPDENNMNMDVSNETLSQIPIQPESQEFGQTNIPLESQEENDESTYNNDVNNLLNDINNTYGFAEPQNNVEISDISLSDELSAEPEEIQDDISDNDSSMDSATTDNVEIIDLDQNTDSDAGEPKLLSVNIEKIKELIEEIKSTGVSISLEEFDFEEMYQLIIKINK